ncbi:MAG: OmpA family protein [Proteobacteria bacterium]|nr:OmpA family protein [Pseudomonadota bacterium]
MKKNTMSIALAAALLSISVAQAGEFSGGWVGAKAGSDRSSLTTLDTKSANTYGVEAGYNWDVSSFLLGVDGFVDSNRSATHNPGAVSYGSKDYGLDAKLGLPSGNWLPYAKLGYGRINANGAASTFGASGAHLGLGVEYKFAPHWSVAGEYTSASAKNAGSKLTNNNLTIGVNYYFDSPYVAPAAAVAAPVVAKAVSAPAPVAAPQESFKTIFTDKPVTIEGANFDTNSAKLKPAADKKLNEVVDFAAKYKESNLAVTGHTDSTGSKKLNQKLSEKRAASVKAFLVKKGVAADRITTKGEADTMPVGDNKTRAGRAQNRRVEIRSVVREESKVRVSK